MIILKNEVSKMGFKQLQNHAPIGLFFESGENFAQCLDYFAPARCAMMEMLQGMGHGPRTGDDGEGVGGGSEFWAYRLSESANNYTLQ